MKNLIEINKKNAMAGRTPAKFVLHQIFDSPSSYNANGISWARNYTELNMGSVKGMPLVCQFADDNHEIPFGAHGEMSSKDGEIVFEESLVVGSFDNAYIDDNIEVNGEKISGLVGTAYIYNQRFPALVDYLQEQYDNGVPVETSVEICANKSNGNTKIIYDGGWKPKGRVPQDYEYSGQAFCIGVDSADNSALMIELNSAKKSLIETCELSYDDISILITRAFYQIMNDGDYSIYKLYPQSKRVIFENWYKTPVEYYLTTYNIQNNSISLGEIQKVEQDWKPVDDEESVEINIEFIRNYIRSTMKKGEINSMEENKQLITELNEKIEGKINEINELTAKNAELEGKNTELNDAIVNANKSLEEINSKYSTLEEEFNRCKEELNALKDEKATIEAEQKKAEINSYFETEIPKNKFSEEEINALKPFVESIDIEGLKKAESELCAKKFKEMIVKAEANEEDAETNSKKFNFIKINEKEKKVVSDVKVPTLFD